MHCWIVSNYLERLFVLSKTDFGCVSEIKCLRIRLCHDTRYTAYKVTVFLKLRVMHVTL